MDREYEQYFAGRLAQLGWRRRPAVAGTGEAEQESDREAYARLPRGVVLELDEQARNLVVDAVRSGSEGVTLRDDAALLLYSIAFELAARPVVFRESFAPTEFQGFAQLGSDLTHDIALVLQRANEARPSGEGISAHLLIDTLSKSWSSLALAEWRVWANHSG